MTTHAIWPTHVQVIDDLLPDDEHTKLKQFILNEYARQGTYPLINFNHKDLPSELTFFITMMMAAFTEYCIDSGMDVSQFILNNVQVHSLPKYNEQLHNEHIMEPHHDLGESGFTAIVYYIDLDTNQDRFVGGHLALYKELSSMEYPDGIIHVQPKPNRLSMFPARLVHRVKPYFGAVDRLTIATLMKKEHSYNQNKTIQVI